MELKIKALSPKIGNEIPLPYYATPGAAAMWPLASGVFSFCLFLRI